jgi:hypothetical protein
MDPQPGLPSDARVALSGVVTDGDSHAPIRDVVVEVGNGPDAGRMKVTDAMGEFRFRHLKTGRFVVSFSRDGYQSSHPSLFLTADKHIKIELFKR